MDSATPFNVSGGSGHVARSKLQKTLSLFCKQWPYIGLAIVLAIVNILLGIWMISSLHPYKDPLIFAILCIAGVLGMAHFASLCYLIQRATDENSDPSMTDAAYTGGVVLLYAISGIILTVRLPSKCYSGRNKDFIQIGQHGCNMITAMAVSSWLAVIIMIIAAILTLVAARRAINMPPPVSPQQMEAPVMRWLNRNDPFLTTTERYNRQYP